MAGNEREENEDEDKLSCDDDDDDNKNEEDNSQSEEADQPYPNIYNYSKTKSDNKLYDHHRKDLLPKHKPLCKHLSLPHNFKVQPSVLESANSWWWLACSMNRKWQ